MKRQMRMWLIIGLLFVNAVLLGAETALAQSSMRFPSAIVLDWEPDPSGATQAVTVFAVVAAVDPLGGIPSGQVEFFLAGTSLGTAVLQSADGYAVTSITVQTIGDVPAVSAAYLGDASFGQSISGPPDF